MGNYNNHFNDLMKNELDTRLIAIEQHLECDVLSIYGPIIFDLETRLKFAIESLQARRSKCAVILDTGGGIVEIAERIVNIIRYNYREVIFIIPDKAMSAGTVLAMAGDSIFMSYFSVLGPIDPQVFKDDKWIPALTYLNQFKRLIEKSESGKLTTAEFVLLEKFDLGELQTFENAKNLSVGLLEEWLSTYKFKDWKITETQKKKVTAEMKKKRAKDIAETLCNNEEWHSHGRGIDRTTLQKKLNLKIDDLDADNDLKRLIYLYFDLLVEILNQKKVTSFVHSKGFIQ